MGRSITPTYRVEYRDNMIALGMSRGDAIGVDGKPVHSQAWNCKVCGSPSVETLEAWRVSMNKSFANGGVNAHVSEAYGAIVHICSAAIVRQSTRKVVCKVQMPMFEVV